MIYFLFWLVVVLESLGLIGQLFRVFKTYNENSKIVGGIIGTLLRSATIFCLLILVYPVLKFVS